MGILVTTGTHCLKAQRPTAASGKGPIRGGNPPSDGYALDVPDEEMGDYKVLSGQTSSGKR